MYNKTRNCPDCNNIVEYNSRKAYYWANKHNCSCRQCGHIKSSKAQIGKFSGANHPNFGKFGKDSSGWKGGVSTDKGYVRVYQVDQKYKYEHRIIFEKYLGRELLNTDVIHHENEIRNDNRIENLILFNNNGDHRKWHGGNKKVEHIKGKDLK